jgi:plastocyanin
MNRLAKAQRWVVASVVALVLSASPFMPAIARADTGVQWQVDVGAESKDMAIQVAYFFPGDLTINAGDTVTWNFKTGEIHSVNFFAGTGSGGPVDSPVSAKGAQPFSLKFDQAGDYNYGCDIHTFMKGVVHVQATGSAYPHDKKYYQHQSQEQKHQLLDEGRDLKSHASDNAKEDSHKGQVTAGIGVAHDTGSIFIMRFMKRTLNVKVGDTVTWSNLDPEAPHSITFNMDFANPFPDAAFPAGLDIVGPPGHATMNATTQQVNSGFLWAAPFPNLPPPAYVGTTFQVKFTQPGTYNYKCELHDNLGMTGTIKVSPKNRDSSQD